MERKTLGIAVSVVTAFVLTTSFQACDSVTHGSSGPQSEKGGEGIDGKPYQIYGSCGGKVGVSEIVVVSPDKTSASVTRENCQDVTPPKSVLISDLKFSYDASALELKGKIFDERANGVPQRVTHSICKSNGAMQVETLIWSESTGSTLFGRVTKSDGATSGILQVVPPVAQAPSRFVSVAGQSSQFDLTLDGPLSYSIGSGATTSIPGMSCVSQTTPTLDCTQILSVGVNLSTAISSAAAGAVICLNSGSYGAVNLNNVQKNPRVTVRSVSGKGAAMTLEISNGTNGVTFDNVTVTSGTIIGSSTKNITIQNSIFTDVMFITDLSNSNVLLDRNVHNNIGAMTSSSRIHLNYTGSTHSGVTIQNSLFDGGTSGGINSGSGVNILNNEIGNLTGTAISLIGASDFVVRGNYIHQVSSGIVAIDGPARGLIENNVVNTGNNRWGIELYSDTNSIVRHNTFPYIANCSFGTPCGNIYLGRGLGLPVGAGTIVENNIATSISANDGSTYSGTRNLVRTGAGAGDITGSPTYVGGSLPNTLDGFQLTPLSLGYQGGSDGLNIGAK